MLSITWLPLCFSLIELTHLPLCCIYALMNQMSIGSDNSLSPIRRQAIIQTIAGLLSIGPSGTNFSGILIKMKNFSFMKMHLKISSAKWRPFCPEERWVNPELDKPYWWQAVGCEPQIIPAESLWSTGHQGALLWCWLGETLWRCQLYLMTNSVLLLMLCFIHWRLLCIWSLRLSLLSSYPIKEDFTDVTAFLIGWDYRKLDICHQ